MCSDLNSAVGGSEWEFMTPQFPQASSFSKSSQGIFGGPKFWVTHSSEPLQA
jgi:hypothetical protein